MVTIRDVAKLAGVSTATVSHVLNDSRWVTPATRRRVLDAVARLNYYPSGVARSLSTNITRSVGILVADITNPFFAAIVRGIEDRLSAQRYNLIVCNTDESPDKERRYLELLLARRVDGLIIAPAGTSQPFYREFISQQIPLVFIDRRPTDTLGPVICADNLDAGYRATRYLIDAGHGRIAILARHPTLSTVVDRIGGYRRALQEHNIPPDESLVAITESSPDAAARAAQDLMRQPNRPTAFVATNLHMTLGILRALNEQQLACPADVSLVCFDDYPWAALFSPPLTVIQQPIAAMCDAAVNTLLRAIEMRPARGAEPTELPALPDVVLKTTLIERASCRFLGSTAAKDTNKILPQIQRRG